MRPQTSRTTDRAAVQFVKGLPYRTKVSSQLGVSFHDPSFLSLIQGRKTEHKRNQKCSWFFFCTIFPPCRSCQQFDSQTQRSKVTLLSESRAGQHRVEQSKNNEKKKEKEIRSRKQVESEETLESDHRDGTISGKNKSFKLVMSLM